MVFFLISKFVKLRRRNDVIKRTISPPPLNTQLQWGFPAWLTYLNHPDVQNRPFTKSYIELHNISNQLKSYVKKPLEHSFNPLTNTPYEFIMHTKTLSSRLKSFIPGTKGFQARVNFAYKLSEVEKFIESVEKDIAVPRKLEIYVQEQLQSLIGTKLLKLMSQSAKIMKQLERFKNSQTRPIYFLEHDYVKQNSNYAAFMFVSNHLNQSKNNIVHAAKPEFYSPLKPINRNQIINIFPEGSVYKNFINQTSSWWGNLKSYVPFTDAYKAKNDMKKELKKVKRFIKITVKEFSEHTRADLVVKYPKIAPHMEPIAQAAGIFPNVSVTDESGADLKLNIRDSAKRPDKKQPENPVVPLAPSSAARILMRTSDDPLNNSNKRQSPRTLEGLLQENMRFFDAFDQAAQARLQFGTDASKIIESMTTEHAQPANILTDKDHSKDNLPIKDVHEPNDTTRKVRFTAGTV